MTVFLRNDETAALKASGRSPGSLAPFPDALDPKAVELG